LRARAGKPPAPEFAILTGSGSIDPAHPVLGSRSVVLTSSVGSERLDGRLPPGTSLVELGEDLVIDGKLVVDALLDRGHRLILSEAGPHAFGDRKSTRLNSSHEWISYAVFCLKKKNTDITQMYISIA